VEEGKKAFEIAEEFSDSGHSCFAASRIANAYTFMGDLDRAIEYGELALKRATAPTFEAWARSSLASAHCRTKQADKGVDVLAELTAIYRSEGLAGYELLSGGHICEGYLLLKQYEKTKIAAEGLLEVASQCKAKWHIARALRFLGETALKTDPDEAPPHFEKAISLFREIKAENELALAYSGMGRFHKQQGNTEQAREYLTDALEIFERLGTLIEPDNVRKELAELPR
jgi:tetratricopeptide (TPR) repeat protein